MSRHNIILLLFFLLAVFLAGTIMYQGHVIDVQREVIRETVPGMAGPFTCPGPDIKEF